MKRFTTWQSIGLCFSLLLLVLFGITSPASADPGNAGDGACTTANYSGTTFNGSWSRTYNPSCAGNTKAYVYIDWNNTTDGNGHHHVVWSATLQVDQIYGSKCVQIAMDWYNPSDGHSDTQILRNCKENSTVSLPVSQSIDTHGYISDLTNWPIWRLQLGTFDPSDRSMNNVVCPGTSASPQATDGDTECVDWQGAGHGSYMWSSVAAKIYRRSDDGVYGQNTPTYPANYNIDRMTDRTS